MLHAEGFWTRMIGARGAVGPWRMLLGCLAAMTVLALAPVGALGAPVDDSGGAYQILAPGAAGSLAPTEFSTDQGELYSALTPLKGKVTAKKIEQDYLSEKFGVSEVLETETTGHLGLEIIRDKHYIPHIFGETREDAMFGSGWVAAKDRGLLLKLGLGPAYVAALSVPGLNAFELLLTGRSFKPSLQAEEWVVQPGVGAQRKRPPRRTGHRRPRILGGRRERLRGNAAAGHPTAARRPLAGDRRVRLHRLDLRQRRRRRSHRTRTCWRT